MRRIKTAVICLTIAMVPIKGFNYVLVEDIPALIQSEINAVSAYVRQGLQYAQEVSTQVNTNLTAVRELQQVENELLALERAGDMANLKNLPGAQQILVLQEIYARAEADVAQIHSFENPANNTTSFTQILARYQVNGFQGFTSGMGVTINPIQNQYQFQQSNYNVDLTTQDQVQKLTNQKATMTATRDSDIANMNAATDDATQKKYASEVNALNGAIAGIDAQISQVYKANALAHQMNNSGESINGVNNSLYAQQAWQQSVEGGFIPSGDPGIGNGNQMVINTHSSEFGFVDNPANGGNGDPGTSGNFFTGAGGAAIANVDSTGVSLPASTEIAAFGSTQAAMNQPVTVIDQATGRQVQTTIVDIGPGNLAVSQGRAVDLTFGTARALGVTVNGSDPVQVILPTSRNQN